MAKLTLNERAQLRGRIEKYKNNLTRVMGERGFHFAWSGERVFSLVVDELERERHLALTPRRGRGNVCVRCGDAKHKPGECRAIIGVDITRGEPLEQYCNCGSSGEA